MWDVVGMTNRLGGVNTDRLDAFLDQFLESHDAMLDLVAEKVGQLLSS